MVISFLVGLGVFVWITFYYDKKYKDNEFYLANIFIMFSVIGLMLTITYAVGDRININQLSSTIPIEKVTLETDGDISFTNSLTKEVFSIQNGDYVILANTEGYRNRRKTVLTTGDVNQLETYSSKIPKYIFGVGGTTKVIKVKQGTPILTK